MTSQNLKSVDRCLVPKRPRIQNFIMPLHMTSFHSCDFMPRLENKSRGRQSNIHGTRTQLDLLFAVLSSSLLKVNGAAGSRFLVESVGHDEDKRLLDCSSRHTFIESSAPASNLTMCSDISFIKCIGWTGVSKNLS